MKNTVEVDLKWFCFSQNNSGGHFVNNDNVDEYVFIQDITPERAIARAEEFCDNSDSCPCCGDRWSFWLGKDDGTDEPTIYGKSLWKAEKTMFRDTAKLHFFDGSIETYKFGDPPISKASA